MLNAAEIPNLATPTKIGTAVSKPYPEMKSKTNAPAAPSKYEMNSPRIAPSFANTIPLMTTAEISATCDERVLIRISPSTFLMLRLME